MEIFEMTIQDFEVIRDRLPIDFDGFWAESVLREEILNKDRKYIIVKENGEILGFAGIWISPEDIEIMNIVVRKDKRGNGIGKLLLDNIITISKTLRLSDLILEVNEKNIIARNLYEKAGFKTINIRKRYYNGVDDAIIMKLSIDELLDKNI